MSVYNTYMKMSLTKIIQRIERKIENAYVNKDEICYTRDVVTPQVKLTVKNEELKQVGIFGDIIGHDNIKKILKTMVESPKPVSILLDGSAGCAKSMFLKDIERHHKDNTYYVDGSRATKAGIFNVLFEDVNNEIRYLIIDEIEKLSIDDQEGLLTLIEDGRLIQTQKNGTMSKQYDNLSVIAASNDKASMLYPLLTRFYKINIKDYTVEQFKEISKKVLESFSLSPEVSDYIVQKILETKKKPNIRDVKQLAKLCNNSIEMVDLLIESSN